MQSWSDARSTSWVTHRVSPVSSAYNTDMCQCSTSTFEKSYRCTVLDMPESKQMTAQIDWRAKQPPHAGFAARKIWSVEDLETLPPTGHKAKDITPSIAWRRETCKKRGSAQRSSSGGRERTIVNQTKTLELFQGQHWGNSWETGWRA